MKNVIAAAIKDFHAIHNDIELLYRFINAKAYEVVRGLEALFGMKNRSSRAGLGVAADCRSLDLTNSIGWTRST